MKGAFIDPKWMKVPFIDPKWMKVPFIDLTHACTVGEHVTPFRPIWPGPGR